MSNRNYRSFFTGILLPSVLAILLFIVAIYFFLIPTFEKNMMERKKEMIREITQTAWSLLNEYHQEYKDSLLTLKQAQNMATQKIEQLRYGDESKDYFWITDMQPLMIMHPYRKELNGKNLSDYQDPNGKKLFVKAVELIEKNESGFIDYIWQWKDDSTLLVPKLSYVKSFPEWNWIIGTGIYLQDVKSEIKLLKKRLLSISFFITFIVIFLILFIIRAGLKIERKRRITEENLRQSRLKYQSLVEASADGTLMMMDDRIIFSNMKFNTLSKYKATDIPKLTFEELFRLNFDELRSKFDKPGKSVNIETTLICADKTTKEIVLNATKVYLSKQESIILMIREVSNKDQQNMEFEKLSSELQSSLLMMNQEISSLTKPLISCHMEDTIKSAAEIMLKKERDAIVVKNETNYVGLINESDFKNRAIARGLPLTTPVSQIMTSPLHFAELNTPIYQALLKLEKLHTSHLLVNDETGQIKGIVGKMDLLGIQRNTLSFLLKEIEISQSTEQLQKINRKVPIIINSILDSGGKVKNITELLSNMTDAFSKRIIEFCIEEHGTPPCKFAFVALGSEGRKEQTLATDQDNAIIYDNIASEQEKDIRSYFLSLAESINLKLEKVGYELCKGDIMAKNPKWTQSINTWKSYFTKWMNTPDPQNVLETNVFFDFRCVYGDENLVDSLRNHLHQVVDKKAMLLYHMSDQIIKYKTPVNMFGNIVGDSGLPKDTFDIKKVLLPILGFTKIYTLKHKINKTNTLDRLSELYALGILESNLYDELIISYEYLMKVRFRVQIKAIYSNKNPNNLVDINTLNDIDKATLKKILAEISSLQTKLGLDFKGSI